MTTEEEVDTYRTMAATGDPFKNQIRASSVYCMSFQGIMKIIVQINRNVYVRLPHTGRKEVLNLVPIVTAILSRCTK